ncbi:FixH family protein [Emcibacter nanhaiensis]|uniref:FixH family protein n=1 Tax=Emcibacter nanhaiensis TaxID=1505037 RepID=A0A501PN02_9PROT|nr:FixH family protein [Emcibacter nanhaiensis]TPD61880.1 FixH family protein [Emcibacter nanhaiensis]
MEDTSKPFTGKTALLWLTGFFLIVFAVNGVMAWLALDSWNGLSTEDPYRKGLAYNEQIEQDQKQKLSGWKLHFSSPLEAQKGDSLGISLVHPENTAAPGGLQVSFRRPVVEGYDFELTLPLTGKKDGLYVYEAPVDLPLPGEWEITAVAKSDAQTKYILRDRIVVSK